MIRKLAPFALVLAFTACKKSDKTPAAADTKPAASADAKPSAEDCTKAYANAAALQLQAQPENERAGLKAMIDKAQEDDLAACKRGDQPKARITCLLAASTPAAMVNCALVR